MFEQRRTATAPAGATRGPPQSDFPHLPNLAGRRGGRLAEANANTPRRPVTKQRAMRGASVDSGGPEPPLLSLLPRNSPNLHRSPRSPPDAAPYGRMWPQLPPPASDAATPALAGGGEKRPQTMQALSSRRHLGYHSTGDAVSPRRKARRPLYPQPPPPPPVAPPLVWYEVLPPSPNAFGEIEASGYGAEGRAHAAADGRAFGELGVEWSGHRSGAQGSGFGSGFGNGFGNGHGGGHGMGGGRPGGPRRPGAGAASAVGGSLVGGGLGGEMVSCSEVGRAFVEGEGSGGYMSVQRVSSAVLAAELAATPMAVPRFEGERAPRRASHPSPAARPSPRAPSPLIAPPRAQATTTSLH